MRMKARLAPTAVLFSEWGDAARFYAVSPALASV